MILTCPQCATRYQVDGSNFPSAGRNVRCAKCGNIWHQLGPVLEPDPEAEIIMQDDAPQPVPAPVPVQPRAAAFAPVAIAEPAIEEPAPERASWLGRIAIAFGWLVLVGLVLAIAWAAVRFRDTVATWVPQTRSIYSAVHLPVAPRGLGITDLASQHQTENGQPVLVVTAHIVNRGTHELTVPQIRVILFDADRHVLYSWNTASPASFLAPGESVKFRTHLSSPPSGIHDLEVVFARAGE